MDKNGSEQSQYVLSLTDVGYEDTALVGGKSASLGEMLRGLSGAGVRVPDGFSTTVAAYRCFMKENGLDEKIAFLLRQYQT
ncbi:MAG: hypothetical protein J7M20_02695, partial [Deltaproteobacteria bacterium]|nr:hypothetical protein [Deltaproteobacteria bacterium]